MAFHFPQLDPVTRKFMLEEIDRDSVSGIYLSPRLNPEGQSRWIALLRESAEKYDEVWLAKAIRQGLLLKDTEIRANPRGGAPITAKIPVTAAETLAEGEFNRFYIRAICRLAMSKGQQTVVIFRAKEVESPREQSEAQIGQTRTAAALLADLQTNQVDTALGLPPGPNSGLSVRCD
jgi:hypothetical protein